MDELLKSVDERLDQLKWATDGVIPSPGFNGRVMAAVAERGMLDWRISLWRIGRYGLLASFLALAAAMFFAMSNASNANDLQAMSYGTVEMEW